MLQSAKGRYLESYLWEAAVDWRQLFPPGRYYWTKTISNIFAIVRESLVSQVTAKWKNEEKYLFYSVIYQYKL